MTDNSKEKRCNFWRTGSALFLLLVFFVIPFLAVKAQSKNRNYLSPQFSCQPVIRQQLRISGKFAANTT